MCGHDNHLEEDWREEGDGLVAWRLLEHTHRSWESLAMAQLLVVGRTCWVAPHQRIGAMEEVSSDQLPRLLVTAPREERVVVVQL